jgi:mannose-6-phosphate isomerase-like protein (cupin superfamily)
MVYCTKNKFAHPVNKIAVKKDWKKRGYSCNWFIDPPGQQWNNFMHSCNELVTVVEGSLEMTIEGKSWILVPGDEAYIPQGAVHSVKNVYDGSTRWLYGYD